MSSNINIEPEEKLILLCARTQIDEEIKLQILKLIGSGINWQQFFYKASFHGLLSLIYFNLSKFSDQIPVSLILLKEYFMNNSHKNLLFYGRLLELLKIFKENDITIIPYKGPVTAIHNYGNLALREFDDLDFYIDYKDICDVKNILNGEGYEQTLRLDESKEAYYLKYQRELKFKKDELFIEMQWNVAGFSFTFPNEKFFPIDDDYQTITTNNQMIKIFTDEDMLLILSTHVAGHLWSRLSWLCDISELIKNSKKLNWETIIDKAQYLGIERILYVNLSILNKLFDTELPKPIQENITKDQVIKKLKNQVLEIVFNPQNFSFHERIGLRYRMRENHKDGLKDIWKILSVPQSHEWSSFAQKGPISLLYILNRPKQIFNRLRE